MRHGNGAFLFFLAPGYLVLKQFLELLKNWWIIHIPIKCKYHLELENCRQVHWRATFSHSLMTRNHEFLDNEWYCDWPMGHHCLHLLFFKANSDRPPTYNLEHSVASFLPSYWKLGYPSIMCSGPYRVPPCQRFHFCKAVDRKCWFYLNYLVSNTKIRFGAISKIWTLNLWNTVDWKCWFIWFIWYQVLGYVLERCLKFESCSCGGQAFKDEMHAKLAILTSIS